MDERNGRPEPRRSFKYGVPSFVVGIMGIATLGASVFGYMESQLLNTYIDHVLRLDYIFISIMVSSSATMGLIFNFVFGVLSDNTRSRFGRRAPYLLLGGVVSGAALILFGFSKDYAWCFVLDVVVIGIASNAYYAAQRVYVPDLVDMEHRGRVNAIMSTMSIIGLILPVGLTLIADALFTVPDPLNPGSKLVTQVGHIFLLTIGGLTIIVAAVLGFYFLKDNRSPEELPKKSTFMNELRKTFNFEELRRQKEFFKLILAMVLFMSGANAITSYLFNLIFKLGLTTLDLIIILGIAVPVMLVFISLLGRLTDRIGRKRIVPPTILASCAGFILVLVLIETGQLNAILLAIGFSLVLLGMVGIMVPLNTWSHDLLPEEKRGQFTGIYNIINTVSQIFGSMSVGIATTYFGTVFNNPLSWIFIIVPIFFVASIPFFMRVKETLVQREPAPMASA